MKVRACWKCWQYIVIHPNNASNQMSLKKFDKNHAEHGVLTMEIEEVKDRYENVSFLYSPAAKKELNPL
ncbi:MAG: hypothetical protein ACOC44_17035 [Promethearchaeia archaeon]